MATGIMADTTTGDHFKAQQQNMCWAAAGMQLAVQHPQVPTPARDGDGDLANTLNGFIHANSQHLLPFVAAMRTMKPSDSPSHLQRAEPFDSGSPALTGEELKRIYDIFMAEREAKAQRRTTTLPKVARQILAAEEERIKVEPDDDEEEGLPLDEKHIKVEPDDDEAGLLPLDELPRVKKASLLCATAMEKFTYTDESPGHTSDFTSDSEEEEEELKWLLKPPPPTKAQKEAVKRDAMLKKKFVFAKQQQEKGTRTNKGTGKWQCGPGAKKMNEAVKCVIDDCEGCGTVAKRLDIPVRTLRRFVRLQRAQNKKELELKRDGDDVGDDPVDDLNMGALRGLADVAAKCKRSPLKRRRPPFDFDAAPNNSPWNSPWKGKTAGLRPQGPAGSGSWRGILHDRRSHCTPHKRARSLPPLSNCDPSFFSGGASSSSGDSPMNKTWLTKLYDALKRGASDDADEEVAPEEELII